MPEQSDKYRTVTIGSVTMLGMGKIWAKVVDIMRLLRLGLTQPLSDRTARISLVIWITNVILEIGAVGLNLFPPIAVHNLLLTIPTLVFGVTMLKWSIQGILHRRAERHRAEEEQKFYDVLIGGYITNGTETT
jgi:hypothetical protein